jgi:hypothetical protein
MAMHKRRLSLFVKPIDSHFRIAVAVDKRGTKGPKIQKPLPQYSDVKAKIKPVK